MALSAIFLELDGETLATSEVTPGFFCLGRNREQATVAYTEILRRHGGMPMLDTAPTVAPAQPVPDGAPRTLYVGFPSDLNFGDRWMYRMLAARLPKLAFVHPRSLDCMWKRMLPQGHFDLAMLGGGTLINQKPQFYNEVRNCLLAGLPVVCFGTGVGNPERWGDHLAPWVELLEQFRFVGVRGPESFKRLREAGLTKHRMVGDPCLLDTPDFKPRPARARPEVWVDLSYGAAEGPEATELRFRLLKGLDELERKGLADLRFYTTWEVYSPWVLAQLQMFFGRPRELVSLREDNRTLLGSADLCIAYRLHAAAAGLMAGAPTWVVNYEPKCRDLFAYLKLDDHVLEPDRSGIERLRGLFAADLRALVRERIPVVQQCVLEGKRATEEQFKELVEAVGG